MGWHWPMLVGAVVLLALLILIVVLVVRLMQHPVDRPRYPIVSDYPAPIPSDHAAFEEQHGDSERVERFVFLIPDISGYTELVHPSRFSISHAHHIMRSLIDALMDAFIPPFEAARIEGDAVLFHVPAERIGENAERFSQAIERGFLLFDSRLEKLIRQNACPCAACAQLAKLDLKVVIHCGEAIRYRVGPLEDFTGEPLVVVHQLLKNDLGRKRYVLATESAVATWSEPLRTGSIVHELPEGALASGERRCHVFEAPSRNVEIALSAGLSGKASDFGIKVAAAVREGFRKAPRSAS